MKTTSSYVINNTYLQSIDLTNMDLVMIFVCIYDVNNNPHNKVLDLTYSQFDILMKNVNFGNEITDKIANFLSSISSEELEIEAINLSEALYLPKIHFDCSFELDEFVGGFYLPHNDTSLIVNKIIIEK